MLVPIFTLKLNQKVFPRLVTVGKYDGKHPSLTAATNGGKVFIHTPHHRLATGGRGGRLSASGTESDVSLLSIGQYVTSLTAGRLDPALERDALLVGSQTNLLAYDVQQNSDLFYKEAPDGCNSLVLGSLGERREPLAFVGGNCSIQGFDHQGQDQFWTVTGDNVCSLALCDFNSNGQNELIVGSEDYDIRVFQNDELITEMSEAEAVMSLCPIGVGQFGYSLANGIVGVYSGEQRMWRIKSKNQPLCLHSFDIDGDGVPELMTGWSSGKMDVRNIRTGDVIFKDTFSAHIAGIVQADYRLDGKEELICCSVEGEVRGYLPSFPEVSQRPMSDRGLEQKKLEELNKRKQNLLLELKNFEANERVSCSKDPRSGEVGGSDKPMGVIPAGTLLKTEFSAIIPDLRVPGGNKMGPHLELSVETNNDTIIRSVIIFAEGLFDGESHVVHPPSTALSNKIKVPLLPEKDTPIDINIKAFIGKPNSIQFHVFEASRPLHRFSLYIPCPLETEPHPLSSVTFTVNERLERVTSWLDSCFMYGPGEDAVTSPYLHVSFMSLRTNTPLVIKMEPSEGRKMTLQTDDMDLAGDIIQSLAAYLSIEDLQVVADFPKQMEDLRNVLEKVDEFHKVRQQLTAEMADNSGIIRNLVVRAEDARMMNNMASMKKAYSQLYELNRELIMGYRIRSNNHMELLDCLKIVNQAVQKAAKLRVGKPKAQVVAACRAAIKSSDVDSLLRAIKTGAA